MYAAPEGSFDGGVHVSECKVCTHMAIVSAQAIDTPSDEQAAEDEQGHHRGGPNSPPNPLSHLAPYPSLTRMARVA